MLGKLVGVNDVALRLGHLVHAEIEPGVTEHLLGQGQIQRHQENGPVDGVETQNVLADHVHVTGPVFAELLRLLLIGLVGIIAQGGDIVGQGIQPHVGHVLGIHVHGNAPGKGATGHAEILQTRLQEIVDHFLFPRLGLNELGVVLNVLHEAVGVLAHFEEIRFLLCLLYGSAAVGALAVHHLGLGKEGLTGGTVPALIVTLVNVALFVELGKDLAHRLLVAGLGGADEAVVLGAHLVPDVPNDARHVVHVRLGGNACLCRQVLDLLTVLVGARAEIHVIAPCLFVPRHGVGHNDLVGIAEMGLSRGVGNGGGNIEGLFRIIHG